MKHKDQHHKSDEGDVTIILNIEEYFFGYKPQHHHHHHPHHRIDLVLKSLTYKSLTIKNSIIMAVTISSNEFVTGALGLVDHATGNPLTGVTISNANFTSSDPNVFTVAADTTDPNTLVVTGVSVGVGTLTVTADVAYTDPNTGESRTETGKTATISVTVTASQVSTDLVVNFGTPQPKV